MKTQDFIENFSHFVNSPGGVDRLRDVIRQLAVSGKLIPFHHELDDAGELLNRVKRERGSLIESGEIRTPTKLPPVGDSEKSLAAPPHWNWTRLGELSSKLGSGSTPRGGKNTYASGGIPFLRSQNVWNDGIRLDDVAYIDDATHKKMKNTHVRPGDILLNITGASLGRCALVPPELETANVSQHVTIVRPVITETRRFIQLCLLAPFGQKMIWGRQVGMAREGLSKKVLERFELPVPSLEEQELIVKKVDDLMLLCDKLERQQQERGRVFPLLSRTTHSRFVEVATPVNLQAVFTDPPSLSPDDMRTTVLSLAAQGKLSKRDPTSEATDIIIERIAKERKSLGLSTTRSSGNTVESMYDIPPHWRFCLLGDVLILGPTNGFSPKAVEYETAVRSLTLSATTSGRFDGSHSKFIENEIASDSAMWLEDGDILVQRGNTLEYVGVPAVFRGEPKTFIYPDLMMRLRVSRELDVDFIHIVMSAEASRDYLRNRATGTAGSMPKINQKTLKSLPIPIAPLEEQHAIVSRVRKMLTLVDKIERLQCEARVTAELFAKVSVDSLTGNHTEDQGTVEAPKTRLTTRLEVDKQPTLAKNALLASMLAQEKPGLSAKALWQKSGLEIDAFYMQLKTEMANGWIAEPIKAAVTEVRIN